MAAITRKVFLSRGQAAAVGSAVACLLLVQLFTPGRPYFLGAWHMGLAGALALSALASWVLSCRAWLGSSPQSAVRWQRAFWALWLLFSVSLAPALHFHMGQGNVAVVVRLCAWLLLPAVIAGILLRAVAALRSAASTPSIGSSGG